MDAQGWDERYRSAARETRVWSGRPNESLARHSPPAAPWTDGAPRALDIGCGEGADALWLAEQGWQVTGVDWARAALARALEAAAVERGSGTGARDVRFVQGDAADAAFLAGLSPSGTFDLVTVAFLHPEPDDRPAAYGHLPGLVSPGGHLLVIAHDPSHGTLGLPGPPAERLMAPQDILAALGLPDDFEVLVSTVRARSRQDEVVARDSVVLVRRQQ